MRNREIHLFIIWEKGRIKEEEILNSLRDNFIIIKITEVVWSKEHFSENLTRFYGQNLPVKSEKEKHCGNGPFLIIVVYDNNPCYRYRKTSHGKELVNINVFDSKEMYRSWTYGGHKIHATNTAVEANHDITMLMGLNAEDYMEFYSNQKTDKIERKEIDVIGCKPWKDINQLFYVLNNTISYIILRNYEELPEQCTLGKHSDIDILTTSYQNICYITNAEKITNKKYRVQNRVNIADSYVNFDFRYLGDNYYDKNWEIDILGSAELYKNSFYVASTEYYYYSLIYHALVQKPFMVEDYELRLKGLESTLKIDDGVKKDYKNQLLAYMSSKGYLCIEPNDLSVRYNLIFNQKKSIRRSIYGLIVNAKIKFKLYWKKKT